MGLGIVAAVSVHLMNSFGFHLSLDTWIMRTPVRLFVLTEGAQLIR